MKFTKFKLIQPPLPSLLVLLLVWSQALAQENPYQEGLEKFELSKEQQEQLAEYSTSSKALLEKALKESKTQSLHEAYETLINTAIRVIRESHKDKLREELLMRVGLNQTLKLIYGVPNPNGAGLAEPAMLSDRQSPEVYLNIIEDSVRLAIQVAIKDKSAIDGKNLTKLAFGEFAEQRAYLANKWASQIVGWKDQDAFYSESIIQWMNLIKRSDNLDFAKQAAQLDEAQTLQTKLSKLGAPEKVRSYRAFFIQPGNLKYEALYFYVCSRTRYGGIVHDERLRPLSTLSRVESVEVTGKIVFKGNIPYLEGKVLAAERGHNEKLIGKVVWIRIDDRSCIEKI